MVVASVEVKDGRAGAVSFESVPAFLLAGDRSTRLQRYGDINFDMAYGGAFYALADCRQFGLEFGRDRVRDFVDAATALTDRLKAEFPLSHPDHADLAFLYGSILTDGDDAFADRPTRNICVFAEAEVDRSPTGSGVTARLAAMHAKGQIAIGQTRIFESIVGSRFTGAVARTTRPAITTPSSPASAAGPSIRAARSIGSRTATSWGEDSWCAERVGCQGQCYFLAREKSCVSANSRKGQKVNCPLRLPACGKALARRRSCR